MINDSDEQINSRRLLKKEGMNKIGCPHHGADALVAAAATLVDLSSKSNGFTSLQYSKAIEPEEEFVVIGSEQERKAGVTEPDELAVDILETMAVPERKRQGKPKLITTSTLEPGNI